MLVVVGGRLGRDRRLGRVVRPRRRPAVHARARTTRRTTGCWARIHDDFDVDHVWELPTEVWPDGRQCFVNLQHRPGLLEEPTRIIDLHLSSLSEEHTRIDVRRHGTPIVVHDPDGLIELRHDDAAQMRAAIDAAVEQVRQRRGDRRVAGQPGAGAGPRRRGGGPLPALRARSAGAAAAGRALPVAARLRPALPRRGPAGRRGRPGGRAGAGSRERRRAARAVGGLLRVAGRAALRYLVCRSLLLVVALRARPSAGATAEQEPHAQPDQDQGQVGEHGDRDQDPEQHHQRQREPAPARARGTRWNAARGGGGARGPRRGRSREGR